jgi:hypothetical protein
VLARGLLSFSVSGCNRTNQRRAEVSKLNWEKQNKAEQPKEKRKVSNRTKVLKAYQNGASRERERIIKLVEETLLIHTDQKFFLIRSIKGEK